MKITIQGDKDYGTPVDQCRNFIDHIDESVAGMSGDEKLFTAACVIVNDFGLDGADADQCIRYYNDFHARPPWSEDRLLYKLSEARKMPEPAEGRGYRVTKGGMTFVTPKRVNEDTQFRDLLNAAFMQGEYISIAQVVKTADGTRPDGLGHSYTREEWINKWEESGRDLTRLLPSEEGSWIKVNPMQKDGRGDKDVVSFRHTLVESDSIPKDKQEQILRDSNLPITALIDSGGKSIHAWVKVNAKDRAEYDERVQEVAESLPEEFAIDSKNKNPSRYSRVAGVVREGNMQKLMAIRIGEKTFERWQQNRHLESALPPIVNLADLLENPPPEPPQVIEGLIHEGCKMTLSGDSKSRKTWTLMQMGVAVSSGQKFMGMNTHKSKVLFINFELKAWNAAKRLHMVRADMDAKIGRNFEIWNLRGHSAPFEVIRPLFMKKIEKGEYGLIIIDPLYKTLGDRDENSAGDMNSLMNEIEQLSEETGTAVVIATHHAKSGTAEKSVANRTSGSGVMGRDPDSIISMSPHPDVKDAMVVDTIQRNNAQLDQFCVVLKGSVFVRDDSISASDSEIAPHMEMWEMLNGIDDWMSFHDIKKTMADIGWSKSKVDRALKECEKERLIEKRKQGRSYSYKVKPLPEISIVEL